MSTTHYDSYTDARAHLKDLLDAAERGRVATVRRDARRTAVVDVERLRSALARLSPSRAQVVAEPTAGRSSSLGFRSRPTEARSMRRSPR